MRGCYLCATLPCVADVSSAVEHKDVVLALLGVSSGLAGLVLVFLGLILNTLASFAGDTPESVLVPYRRAVVATLLSFGVGIACVVLAFAWLVELSDNHSLYILTVTLFGIQVAALLGTTLWTAARLVWGD